MSDRILKAAAADPSATHAQIAQRAGCHTSTVSKHLSGRRPAASQSVRDSAGRLLAQRSQARPGLPSTPATLLRPHSSSPTLPTDRLSHFSLARSARGGAATTAVPIEDRAAAAYRRADLDHQERIRIMAELQGDDPDDLMDRDVSWLLILTDDEIKTTESGDEWTVGQTTDPRHLHHLAKSPRLRRHVVHNGHTASETLHQTALAVQQELRCDPVNPNRIGQDSAADRIANALDAHPGSRPDTVVALDQIFDELRERSHTHLQMQAGMIQEEFHPTKNKVARMLRSPAQPSKTAADRAATVDMQEVAIRQEHARHRAAGAAKHAARACLDAAKLDQHAEDSELHPEIAGNVYATNKTLRAVASVTQDRLDAAPLDDTTADKRALAIRNTLRTRGDSDASTVEAVDALSEAVHGRRRA